MTPVSTAPVASNGNPAPAETPKPKPLTLTTLSYEAVCALAADEQDALMKGFFGTTRRLSETRDEVKTASKYAAILLAGVEQRVKRGIEARVYASTFTASDLYKQVTGEKPPGHVWTMKNAFVNFVVTGLIAESDFVANRTNCLEIAQRICDAVFEIDPAAGLQHDAISRAASELKTRSDNEAKVLRGILNSVKPAKPLTAEQALVVFEEICGAGHLPVILAQLPDTLVKLSEQYQKEGYIACANTIEKVEIALGDKAEAWMRERVEAAAPVTVLPQPEPPAEPETPVLDDSPADLEPAELAAA